MFLWTREEIESILVELNRQGLPFASYPLRMEEGESRPVFLGSGGYACVYEAVGRSGDKRSYAVKIIGFGEQCADEQMFRQAVQAQMELGNNQEHVVKIYDAVCLEVWLDPDGRVTKAERRLGEDTEVGRYDGENPEDQRRLSLQFILMEKLEVVLHKTIDRKYRIVPQALASFEEKEIRRLAFDIGTALVAAHDKKILHRDIKPENLFYSMQTGQYKLGDFGIALKTADGMASTVAYTDGYGAPEVIYRSDDKYDYTADIYSLGMTLYVLLNRMKFPNSGEYQVNGKAQYEEGFVLPAPETGSEAFARIVEKMCRFDPDERYQSMDEVLLELEALENGELVKYQKKHKETLTLFGMVSLVAGMAMWKLCFLPELKFVLSPAGYVFLGLCVLKYILAKPGKDITGLRMAILVLGVGLCISTGFVWWKPLLLLLLFAEDTLGGFWGIGILAANLAYLTVEKDAGIVGEMQAYRWVAVTLLPIAVVLFIQLYTIKVQERKGRQYGHLTTFFLRANLPWLFAVLFFWMLIIWGWILADLMTGNNRRMLEGLFGSGFLSAISSIQPLKAGVAGLAFSLFWIVRQRVLMRK